VFDLDGNSIAYKNPYLGTPIHSFFISGTSNFAVEAETKVDVLIFFNALSLKSFKYVFLEL